jgi:hypothetical protein
MPFAISCLHVAFVFFVADDWLDVIPFVSVVSCSCYDFFFGSQGLRMKSSTAMLGLAPAED